MSLSVILGIAALLVLATVWWGIARLRRIREQEARRGEQTMAELRASRGGNESVATDEAMAFLRDADFGHEPAGSPRAFEVAEFDEGVDIEALLADERDQVAARSRETLAEVTRIGPPRAVAAPPVRSSRESTTAGGPGTAAAARGFVGGGDLIRNDPHGLPLREVALAWFEARGYRSSAASPAVRPIECVLRHRQDATRAYAFVVEQRPVSGRRVEQLQALALSVGLKRVLVVAEAGAEGLAQRDYRGVRLMDRGALAAELDRLDLSIAAKIIAVARKRAAARGD